MFKILVQNEDLSEDYIECHLDKKIIKGYYVSVDDIDNDTVNLITTCGGLNCKRTAKLMDWLTDKFK